MIYWRHELFSRWFAKIWGVIYKYYPFMSTVIGTYITINIADIFHIFTKPPGDVRPYDVDGQVE
jgi:hypothetical protein